MVRKTLFVALLIIAGLIITGFVGVQSWRQTPFGTLHTNAAILLKGIEILQIDLFKENKSLRDIRETSQNSRKFLQKKTTPIFHLKDTAFAGPAGSIRVRIYTPSPQTGLPVILYFRGGGWIMGNLDSHDNICRLLANSANGIVVSVDYRLAPEHPFPAAVNDAYAALNWVSENAASFGGDPDLIAIAGDSAGGNLAAGVALMSRDRRGPKISAQVLIYPVINAMELNTKSYRQFKEGFYLTKQYMENFIALYLPNQKDRQHPYASPLLAGSLADLPPALVLTAEFDPLRDEGLAYAEKLHDSGVPITHIRYQGMIHGFVGMDRLFGQSKQAITDISDYLGKHLQ